MLDLDGQPLAAFNKHRNLLKSLEALLGLCRGLIADNHLNEQEIVFLDTWLKNNEELTRHWPGDVIARRVAEVLADGIVTAEEAEDLKQTLAQAVGGDLDSGIVGGLSTTLPVQPVHSINFEERRFCLTGKFLYGSRAKCTLATEALGGYCIDNVITDLDYLVIGTLASRDWINTSHGRKIEKALAYQTKGHPITIISEENWAQFV